MDKDTIFKCIEVVDAQYNYHYNLAMLCGASIAKQHAHSALVLKRLKNKLWEMYQEANQPLTGGQRD